MNVKDIRVMMVCVAHIDNNAIHTPRKVSQQMIVICIYFVITFFSFFKGLYKRVFYSALGCLSNGQEFSIKIRIICGGDFECLCKEKVAFEEYNIIIT